MKPLFTIVVAILVIAATAHKDAAVKPEESKDPVEAAEGSEPQDRQERCTTCSGTISLKNQNAVLAAIKNLPNAEVHTQQSFEECSSDKGCAGIKLKDGKVVQKFGNAEAFKAALASSGGEFQFLPNSVFEGGVPNGGPYWWMNQDSPFKNVGANGAHSQKFSKFESYSSSTGSGGDIAGNPFLNGEFSKLNFAGQGFQAGAGGAGFGGAQGAGFGQGGAAFGGGSQSSYGSSSQSSFSAQGAQGGLAGSQGFGGAQGGFNAAQGGFNAAQGGLAGAQGGLGGGQSNFNSYNSASKFASTGYTGSSPAPFAPSGSNVNLIQNSQKFDFDQQQQTQQSIDEAFQSTGNVQSVSSGGDLQQTCAGQGYICVHKAQCNNGVVNTNGGSLLQANTQKQYCNLRTEVCCRLETSSLSGAGSLQGNLGVGSATFTGSNQGSDLFSQSGSSQSNFGAASGFTGGQATQSNTGFGITRESESAFGSNTNQFSGAGSQFGSNFANTNKFAGSSTGFGSTLAPTPTRFAGNSFNNDVFKSTSQSNFVETDSFSSGSENTGIIRPGTTGLKPGIPYLPPVDTATSGTNQVSSTAFVTTPRPFTTPRPVSTPRPFTTPRPTYLPPVSSTSAPGYLPPVEPIGSESRDGGPYVDGSLLLDQFPTTQVPLLPPRIPVPVPVNTDIPSGCAAALKCTPIEFCTAEGVISNTTVVLTRDQAAYRVPLTDCKDVETGRIGKCCRDPYYTDPWPVNQIGKWVPDVFGGNDGRYTPDSRGSPSISRPGVTARPPNTGELYVDQKQSTLRPILPQGPNQVTPGFPSSTVTPFVSKTPFTPGPVTVQRPGQYGQAGVEQRRVIGQGSQTTQGIFGVNQGGGGSTVNRGQTSFGVTQNRGTGVNQGFGTRVTQGFGVREQGQTVTQNRGTAVNQGIGSGVNQDFGASVNQGFGVREQGFGVTQGQNTGVLTGTGTGFRQDQGTIVTQGVGQGTRVGEGFGIRQGGGATVSQGSGFGVTQGGGATVSQGSGFGVTQGGGAIATQGSGFGVQQGGGAIATQGGGFGIRQGGGATVSQGSGFGVQQGGGAIATQGGGFGVQQGGGAIATQGGGFGVQRGGGATVSQGSGFGIQQGGGATVSQGTGFGIQQGGGFGIRQGEGTRYQQGTGFGVNTGRFGFDTLRGTGQALTQGQGEQESSESVSRVFLTRYSGSGQCGLLNPQKPYGNHKDLEVDFAEIPWQAMVLLQTNRSLLCGGVITRPDVVITTASCVEGLEAKNVLIKGGEWKLGIDEEPLPFQIVQVKTILRHPYYKKGSLRNDAAILVLTENLRLAKNIWPICLPSANDNLDAFYNGAGECIVTGWGQTVLQAHLLGSVMHGLNVSLLNPGECQNKIQQDYPHLLDNYDQDSSVCGQPTNPANNICKVDTGSALACTTGDGSYVLRGIYSWDSGCQVGNQLAAFYRFDLEWYEWAIGLIESVRFAKFTTVTVTKNKIITQVTGSTVTSGVKGVASGVKGGIVTGIKGGSVSGVKQTFGVQGQGGSVNQFGVQGQSGSVKQFGVQGQTGLNAFGLEGQSQSGEFSQFGSTKFTGSGSKFTAESGENGNVNFGSELNGPLSKTFTATFSEKKFFQTEPKYVTYTTKPEIVTYTTKPEIVTFTTKPEYFTYTTKPKIVTYTTKPEIVTYTTKPEIVTFTTKPEYFTYTTKPKLVTYTTKPQIISYETSGSQTNPKYVSPALSFTEVVGSDHKHSATCKCLENGKK